MSLLTESPKNEKVASDDIGSPRKYDTIPHCQYNDGVACELEGRKCNRCGWNPVVSEMRKQAIYLGDTHFLRFTDRDFSSYQDILDEVASRVGVQAF